MTMTTERPAGERVPGERMPTPTPIREILRRAGPPIPPEGVAQLGAIETEIHEFLDTRRTELSDLYRIANLVYNIKHGDMIALCTELHQTSGQSTTTSPEDISKLLFAWAKSKVEELLPDKPKRD